MSHPAPSSRVLQRLEQAVRAGQRHAHRVRRGLSRIQAGTRRHHGIPRRPDAPQRVQRPLASTGASSSACRSRRRGPAGTLPPDRATTGAAVLTMSRQLGSAIGIAILVALLASPHPGALALFRRGWLLIMAAAAAAAPAGWRGARTRRGSRRV